MKKMWQTPKMLVMHRGKCQESILETCKGVGGTSGSYDNKCYEQPECLMKCQAAPSG